MPFMRPPLFQAGPRSHCSLTQFAINKDITLKAFNYTMNHCKPKPSPFSLGLGSEIGRVDYTGNHDIVSSVASAGDLSIFGDMLLGGQHAGVNLPERDWMGNVSEVIVLSSTSTAAEREQIESYLAIKYGLTLGYKPQDFDIMLQKVKTLLQNENYEVDPQNNLPMFLYSSVALYLSFLFF